MRTIISVSIPEDLIVFLNDKDTSKYIQSLIRKAKEEYMKNEPELLKEEIKNIEKTVSESLEKRDVFIKKLSIHMEQKNISDQKERDITKQQLADIAKEKQEKINIVKSIPDIDTILKQPISGKSDFDYYKIIDKIRAKQPKNAARPVGIYELKAYVEFKQNGDKL